MIFKILVLLILTGCKSSEKYTIETFSIKSKVFGNERTLRVFLPKEYDGKREFKVLYLNDGQNLFRDNEFESKNKWDIDEIADSLIRNRKIEPLIIVGIDNAGKERGNEYLPWQDIYLNPPIPNPNGKKYPDFLINEVMPAIEKKYKVLKGKRNTGLGGSSYGGLITLYTILNKPETFGFVIIESPSLYVNNHEILRLIESSKWSWPKSIYLGIGTNEIGLKDCNENNEDNKMAVDDVKDLKSLIQEQSAKINILSVIDSCAIHNENAWAKRFPAALQFVLKSR